MATPILTEDEAREELIEALGYINAEAKRELAFDHLNRPNLRWAEQHEFINDILSLLED